MDEVLSRIAAIHQQHALKCYLAIESLKAQFDWPEKDWLKINKLIELEEPSFDIAILKPGSMPFEPVARRRHWVLAHAIYPYAYFTMQDWFNQSDTSEIFSYYVEQCAEKNEYLSHNISVLIAFKLAWPLVKTEKQKLRFIERFCEFVTATFYGNNHQSYPVATDYNKPKSIDEQTVLASALKQPGFWGHNLIALASILRVKDQMPVATFQQLLINLDEQCYWKFEDDTDKPQISYACANHISKQTLESVCFELLINSQRNLHQITLAESACYLFNLEWVSTKQKSQLIDVINHFSKSKPI
ncbi:MULTISPECIES: hypothetical protein [unclassified Shewanella]|uniref:hypothetical protein n=1 Tax=unclassified Shewanella TaxID=196818 RepID=UPI001BC7CAC2|nr:MULTISPECIES: hypothetical protein [unclassified Shewanella]GIU09722.1 hypothetical protein TUM4444_12810 [Shewanella sp. MBTL60-112-B1]GIU34225.1 hypothetical protein TUM4445_22630 [Shewanella sp. MBTL60-112-B2]